MPNRANPAATLPTARDSSSKYSAPPTIDGQSSPYSTSSRMTATSSPQADDSSSAERLTPLSPVEVGAGVAPGASCGPSPAPWGPWPAAPVGAGVPPSVAGGPDAPVVAGGSGAAAGGRRREPESAVPTGDVGSEDVAPERRAAGAEDADEPAGGLQGRGELPLAVVADGRAAAVVLGREVTDSMPGRVGPSPAVAGAGSSDGRGSLRAAVSAVEW